jgi:hypothetical protein
VPYNNKVIKGTEPVTLPSYSAIQFHSQEEHQAALYDACLLIVNTYNGSDMLDGHCVENYNGNVTAYDFMKYARNILNHIAEGN